MKIAVLLSGGVDSSVALHLLKEQQHDLVAFYLKIWLEDELAFLGDCPWEDDLKYARAVCEKLGVPLKIVPLQQEYFERVVSYTIAELKAGRTPSPDIFCNKRIKFGVFYDEIDDSYAKIATGHYARLEPQNGDVQLKIAPDAIKDQTYFLAHLSQKQLARALFPVGGMCKAKVRELAFQYDLLNKDRPDSQGICFLGKIKYNDFARHYLGERRGDIIELASGKKLGEHRGYWYHTIGQRKGLGLSGGPWYVVQKDIENNIIYIGSSYNKEKSAREHFKVRDFNWINQPPAKEKLRVKIRHGPQIFGCRLTFPSSGSYQEGHVTLDIKDPGVAAGQFAVFYEDDVCLGCGMIAG